MFNWNRIDSFEVSEILEYNSHIEILNTKLHSFKVDNFNIINVNNKEGVLTDSNQAVLSGSNFDYRFIRATIEVEVIKGDIKLQVLSVLVSY